MSHLSSLRKVPFVSPTRSWYLEIRMHGKYLKYESAPVFLNECMPHLLCVDDANCFWTSMPVRLGYTRHGEPLRDCMVAMSTSLTDLRDIDPFALQL